MRRVVSTALVALAVGGCSTIDKINPFSSSDKGPKPAELPAVQGGAELRAEWQAGVGAARDFSFSPAVVGQTVFAAAQDGSISRVEQGRTVWRVNVGKPLSGGVGSDGRHVAVGTSKGEVIVLDAADGREAWQARVSSEVLAAPALSGGLVVVRSGDSRIFAFEAADGKRRWVYTRSVPALSLRSTVGVVIEERVTLAGFPGGKLVAIANNNGAVVWEVTVALPRGATELERVADVTSNPVIDGNMVCAAAFQGKVSCFDTGGGLLWSRELSSSKGIDIDERHVYATDDKGAVHALDRKTGASVWKQNSLFLRGVSRPFALGPFVAVGDLQGYVHLLRIADGAFAARAATDGSAIRSDPAALDKGFVVQTANGGVFAFAAR